MSDACSSPAPISPFEAALALATRIDLMSEDGYARIPGRRDRARQISAVQARYVCEQSHMAVFAITAGGGVHSLWSLRDGVIRRVDPKPFPGA